jgi:hypothetical protein
MTKPRETRYARELASAKLPSGPGGKSSVAIERLHVKQADQVKIRFSQWAGSRMMPRPLDLPEEELLPLLDAAIRARVFSDEFTRELRRLLSAAGPAAERPAEQPAAAPAADLKKVQAHFHALIRVRAGDGLGAQAKLLPALSRGTPSETEPGWFAVEGMDGGFKYWWDESAAGLRLMSESWSRGTPGSGQLHEITPNGASLLGEGFI